MPKKGAKTIGIRMYAAIAYSGHCDLQIREHGQAFMMYMCVRVCVRMCPLLIRVRLCARCLSLSLSLSLLSLYVHASVCVRVFR